MILGSINVWGKFEKPTDLGSLLRFLRIFDLDSGHEASQRHQKNPKKDGFKLCRLGLSADFVFFFVGGSFLQIPHCSYFSATKQMKKMQDCKSEDDFRGIWSKWDLLFEKNKSQSVFKQTAVSNFLFLMPSFEQKTTRERWPSTSMAAGSSLSASVTMAPGWASGAADKWLRVFLAAKEEVATQRPGDDDEKDEALEK